MATAQDFISKINQINGVDSCLLVKNDGTRIGNTCRADDPEIFADLMLISNTLADDITAKTGFSRCRHLSFSCQGSRQFYVFPIDNYLLGVIQADNAHAAEMLSEIDRLISRVSTGGDVQR